MGYCCLPPEIVELTMNSKKETNGRVKMGRESRWAAVLEIDCSNNRASWIKRSQVGPGSSCDWPILTRSKTGPKSHHGSEHILGLKLFFQCDYIQETAFI